MKKNRRIGKSALLLGLLVLLLVMIYSGLRILESTVLYSDTGYEEVRERKTITRNGKDYFPRQDLTVVMVLGIDQYGPVQDSGYYSNHGMADMAMLLIFDERDEVCRVLQLNRDTMLEMPYIGITGEQAGTYFGQLALSHSFGSGLEDSCENTRQAISDFLNGLHIDYYVSMNMDAIAILNDAVGGVTVNVTEDFSEVDPTIKMGEQTLMGQQSINFVRTRKDVGDQLNLSRLDRQKEYMEGFISAFKTMRQQDSTFFVSAYEAIAPYIVSDCSVNALQGILDHYGHYPMAELITPEGENVMGEQYFEFYVDEAKLDELVLRLFYIEK